MLVEGEPTGELESRGWRRAGVVTRARGDEQEGGEGLLAKGNNR